MTLNELNIKCNEKYNDLTLKLHDVENRVGNLEALIEKLSTSVDAIQSLALSVDKLAINVDNTLKELKAQGARLSSLESKPAKKWELMVQAIITTIVGIIIGWAFSKLIGGSI